MAFIVGTDTRDTGSLGNGSPVGNLETQIFYTPDSTLSNYNPYAQTSTWVRVKSSELKTSETTNQTPYYDQFEEIGVKAGRVESTFELSQDYFGLAESIEKLKNQELWYAEGIQDDRVLLDAAGDPVFQEVNFYKAKLIDITTDKSEIWRKNGSGKYNTASSFTVMKGITPVSLTATATGGNGATSGTPKTITVVGKDLYDATITLDDLSVADLAGEITSLTIEKVSGSATLVVESGVDDKTFTCTLTGSAGANVIRAKAVTKNGGTYYSAGVTLTIS